MDAPKNIIVQLGRIAAAMEDHIADTFTDCLFEPSGDAAIVQFFQKAILLVVQQVWKVISGGFLRKLLGEHFYNLTKTTIGIQQELIP